MQKNGAFVQTKVHPAQRVNGAAASRDELGKGERLVLTAIAQYGSGGVEREQLFVLTGYKSTSLDTYMNRIRKAG